MKTGRRHYRSLIWRTALAALPLAILSGLALYFLREDRSAIEKEARDRAQPIAHDLARRLGGRVAEAIRRPLLAGTVAGGRIQRPRDYARLPAPETWPDRLNPEQSRLWTTAQDAVFQRKDSRAASTAIRLFIAAGVPAAARATAEYRLMLLDADRGVSVSLARRAAKLAGASRGALTESGTPVADLALLLALRAPNPLEEVLFELDRSVRDWPTFLTGDVISAAERSAPAEKVQALKAAWDDREKTLALMRDLLRRSPDRARPALIWLEAGTESFLALPRPIQAGNPGEWEVSFVPARVLEQSFRKALAENQALLPSYAGASVEVGGRRWPIARSPDASLVLASAEGPPDTVGPRGFTLRLELADAETLYAPFRRRLWFLTAIVVLAATTALFGIVSLWRGWERQAFLSEMKSSFVSSVSHELRTPIASMQLMAESLDHGRITEESGKQKYYRLIVQECRRLSALVENVLDLSRIDQGRKQYRFAPVDLAPLVQRTVGLMEPYAAERNVRLLMYELPAMAETLRPCWDEEAVIQALVNLVDNAIKHSPAAATVEIGTEIAESGAIVRFWVQDEGLGIPADAQERIFEVFHREGSELRRETAGAGIGLSIVKHVADAHGGRVTVKSSPGRGARFDFELPAGRTI